MNILKYLKGTKDPKTPETTGSFPESQIVPSGRTLDEYILMFSLSEKDFAARILDCGGGPASFNAEMTQAGRRVVSCDPVYAMSPAELRARIEAVRPQVVEKARKHADRFVLKTFRTWEEYGESRHRASETFLNDFEAGLAQGRYLAERLPKLSFPDDSFDLVLVSHLLFFYSGSLSTEFHIESFRELLRLAKEIRVYPLLGWGSKESPHMEPTLAALRSDGAELELVPVKYEYMVDADKMLVIRRPR